jgi:transcriptional regulator with GAF, ATPase, and Fis domain
VAGHTLLIRRFELVVVAGQDLGARVVSSTEELTVGTAPGADLPLTDPAVSRLHCAIRVTERGLELRDLGSTNGTYLEGHEVARLFVRARAEIRVGYTTIAIAILDDEIAQPLAPTDRFGELIGGSPAMRRLYPLIEQFAQREAPVLVTGETGTGKQLVAEAIHLASARRDRPFVVIDCSTLPRQLAEVVLFGNAPGAPGMPDGDRPGAFEDADGGTLLLDEIGDLPIELQPLLRRVLEDGVVRRGGGDRARRADVRVIAASHRDLRVEVNARRFRADLYYRLDVLRLALPPLREREGDVALLAAHFWRMLRRGEDIPAALLAALTAQSWPGNVRELRNAVERSALVGLSLAGAELSYGQAKEEAVRLWERHWLERLLASNDHNLSRSARAARMGRSSLRQLCQRHGLRAMAEPGPDDHGPGQDDQR